MKFSTAELEAAKRAIRIIERAHDAHPYHPSVTPMGISGHQLRRDAVTLSYKVADRG